MVAGNLKLLTYRKKTFVQKEGPLERRVSTKELCWFFTRTNVFTKGGLQLGANNFFRERFPKNFFQTRNLVL